MADGTAGGEGIGSGTGEAPVRRPEAAELAAALDAIPARVFLLDAAHRIRWTNAAGAAFFGTEPDALTGRAIPDLIDPEAFACTRATREAAIGGTAQRWCGWLRDPGGRERYIVRDYLPHRGPDGPGYVVITRDDTERAAAEAQAQRADGLLREALESLRLGVGLEDPAGCLVQCNAPFAAFYGVPAERLIGLDFAARMALLAPRLADVGGEPVTDAAGAVARLAALRAAGVAQVEVGTHDGRRFMNRSAATAEGGRVVVYDDVTEMRARDRETAEARRMLAEAMEALPDGLGIEDAEGRILACNRAYADYYGTVPERLIGLPFDTRMAIIAARLAEIGGVPVGDDPVGTMQRLAAARREALVPQEAVLRDGRRYLNRRAETADGGRVVVYTDVTDLRRAEAAMRENWETLTGVLEACPTPISMSRASDSTIIYENPAKRALMGEDDAAAVGKRAGSYWRDPDQHARARAMLLRDGRVDDLEVCMVREDGRELWLSMSARLAQVRGEAVFVTATTDLTDRRRAEAAMREGWETLTRVMEVCPAPIAMTRAATGEILYANPALHRVLGLEPGAAELRPARDNWRDPAEHAAAVAELRRTGRIDGREACFVRRDGTEVWLAMSARVANFRGEEVFVTCSVDLSTQRAQEAELARQREIAHQAEKLSALGELLAGVSHELNNPLTVIVGEAAILRETAETDWVRDRAERLADAADRCARIVRSFLAMARQGPARRDAVDLAAVAAAAADLAQGEVRAAGAVLELDLDPAAPVATGDVDQLRQVTLNLLVNAAHAVAETPGPRRIVLRVAADRGRGAVRLSVTDSGSGVPAAIAGRIFEPLFTTKPVGRGSGLGLALSHRLVAAHGGRLSLRNPGQPGAVFDVVLPAGGPATDGAAAPAAAPQGLRVLVVDDDAEVARTTAALLRMDGHAVTLAASGREALARVAAEPFDLVITDMRMPEMDGLEFWRRLCAQCPPLAETIAFATGDLLSPDVAAALRATGRPVLEKPFLPGDLRGIIAAARERRAFAAGGRAPAP